MTCGSTTGCKIRLRSAFILHKGNNVPNVPREASLLLLLCAARRWGLPGPQGPAWFIIPSWAAKLATHSHTRIAVAYVSTHRQRASRPRLRADQQTGAAYAQAHSALSHDALAPNVTGRPQCFQMKKCVPLMVRYVQLAAMSSPGRW